MRTAGATAIGLISRIRSRSTALDDRRRRSSPALPDHWAAADQIEPAATLIGHLDAHEHHVPTLTTRRGRAAATVREHSQAATWMEHDASLQRDEIVRYALDRLQGEHRPP